MPVSYTHLDVYKRRGYGFIRSDNYLPGENDIYINPAMIRRYNLTTGDILCGNVKVKAQTEKFAALLYLKSINGCRPDDAAKRRNFEDLTPKMCIRDRHCAGLDRRTAVDGSDQYLYGPGSAGRLVPVD